MRLLNWPKKNRERKDQTVHIQSKNSKLDSTKRIYFVSDCRIQPDECSYHFDYKGCCFGNCNHKEEYERMMKLRDMRVKERLNKLETQFNREDGYLTCGEIGKWNQPIGVKCIEKNEKYLHISR